MLRDEVNQRWFGTGLALGHVLGGSKGTTSLAQSTGAHHHFGRGRAAWVAAEAQLGSGADQSEIIRWLDTVAVQEPNEEG